MPPAVRGDTSPAASPARSTRSAAKGSTRAPIGMSPPARAAARQHAFRGERLDPAADRNEPAAAGDGPRGGEIEQTADFLLERSQVEAIRPPRRKPHWRDAVNAGYYPGDIAARKPRVDEAMQPVRIYAANAAIFGFHAGEKSLSAAEAEGAGHRGVRTIGADQVARTCGTSVELDPSVAPACTLKALVVADRRPGALRLARQPLHECRGVGGQKIVARRLQIDISHGRRVNAHAAHAPGQSCRHLPAFGRLLHQQTGGADHPLLRGATLDHQRAHAAQRHRARTGEPRETGADNHDVEILPRWRHGAHAHDRRCENAGNSRRTCASREASTSPTMMPGPVSNSATTTPHGSMNRLWPNVRLPFGCTPPCAAAST